VPIQKERHAANEPCGRLPPWAGERRGEKDARVLGTPGAQSSFPRISQQMSLFTHQIKPLPGSKGPLEKATAGYYLKMKYTSSEEHFHLGVRVRAVSFYKGGRGRKFAINLEENVTVGAVPAAAPRPQAGTQV